MKIVQIRRYFNFLLIVSVITLICLILFSFHKNSVNEAFKIASTFILMLLAAGITGCLLGFIFGFPSYKDEQSNSPLERNTSFKQISEWLTKIIVGVSLVQLKDIVSYFTETVHLISAYLEIVPYGSVLISSIIILFLSLGFITGYIITVTDIINIVASSEKKLKDIHDIILSADGIEELDLIRLTKFEKQKKINRRDKKKILEYVHEYEDEISEVDFLKRLAKILFKIGEYSKSAAFYNKIYTLESIDGHQDSMDRFLPKLNEAFIYSKYIRSHSKSNELLSSILTEKPDWAVVFYNLACNYNRIIEDVKKNQEAQEKKKPQQKPVVPDLSIFEQQIEGFLIKVFQLDPTLLTQAVKDDELSGIDIKAIFDKATKPKETEEEKKEDVVEEEEIKKEDDKKEDDKGEDSSDKP